MDKTTKIQIDSKNETVLKAKVKDSIFTNLFRDKKYLLQLYQALHPEDTATTEDELTDVTIKNVLIDTFYNDLGFIVGNRLLIMVEAQSTWTVNIIFRVLVYLAQAYHQYLIRTKQSFHKSRKVSLPKPELYVIYTGSRKDRPEELSMQEEFFDGQECGIEVKVKMIYDGRKGDIINQYVNFTKVCNEQVALHGRTRKAVLETIRICKDNNVLKEYLESREMEVFDIMITLYDDDEILKMYIESEKEEAAEKATKEKALQIAQKMISDGQLPLEKIAQYSGLPLQTIEELAGIQLI
ncbi:MAG: hypothetical protein HFI75_08360 [Lachnospiraceae bacterium]|nr:hypothetical protein [Lachnospiraceae bacterium]